MSTSAPFIRSPRPAGVASYQSSSPRLPSPLNPSLTSFSPRLTERHSPVGEMSDTLSPLRERLESGLTSTPRSPTGISRSRTPSFSRSPSSNRSPERSPVMGTIPFQPHLVHSCHPSPSSSPFTQGIPISSSSPLSTSPLSGPSQITLSHTARPLSPSSSPRSHSPPSMHSSYSQLQACSRCLPTNHTESHIQGTPFTAMPSSSRFHRTQSLFQQSFGNQHAAQIASPLPGSPRLRPTPPGGDSLPHSSTGGSPVHSGHLFTQDTSTVVKGNSTPVNEAPVRWWGGRAGWLDDWNGTVHQPHESDTAHFPTPAELNVAVGTGCPEHACGNPFALRDPFGRPGAFLDEEIRASFDGLGAPDGGFPNLPSSDFVHAPADINAVYDTEGTCARALPIPVPPGAVSTRNDGNYGGVNVGPPPSEGLVAMQNMPDSLTRQHSCHLYGSASGFTHDGTTSIHDHGQERVKERGRRFSSASTCSSASYVSCSSGPSQSQSQLLSMSSSQSHTSTHPSLQSLGVGLEDQERKERRARTLWGRRQSGSALKRQSKDLDNGAHGQGEKDTAKHGSLFMRKHLDTSDKQTHQVGYDSAQKWVSLVITAILPAATITKLSPIGETLIKTAESVSFIGHEVAPLAKDALTASANILSLAPFPGLEEAAKALLVVWDACLKVDTNRLSCLRLAERCATLLYSVLCDINETGMQSALNDPVDRLCGALCQIQTFLETQLHRPFLKRYVRREEIARELQACNDAITDAASRFGLSVQIRIYRQVWLVANESLRFRQEAQALLSLDHQIIQTQLALEHQRAETHREELVLTSKSTSGSILVPNGGPIGRAEGDPTMDDRNNGCSMPPPPYGSPGQSPAATTSTLLVTDKLVARGLAREPGQGTPMSTTFPSVDLSVVTDSTMSAPLTPTPTQAMFVVEETKTTSLKTERIGTRSTPPELIHALRDVHKAQDTVDAAEDEAALRESLAGTLDAQDDVEMVRRLQVGRQEIPEAKETLRRMLDVERKEKDRSTLAHGEDDMRNSELERRFIQTGMEAMTRLAGTFIGQHRGEEEKAEPGEVSRAIGASELPSWTITRYEVIRTRKIGMGFLSDVYLGHWRKLDVVVKVLAHSVSQGAFVRHVEMWNALDHPHVLPLYGASSTVGEKPWFIVSKFCSGDNLMVSLRRARALGEVVVGDKATVRLDLLRFMHEIAKGMAYLHQCGILHGELRAANVLVDENGRCVLSDFGQFEIRSEAHQSCRKPDSHHIRWRAPEILMGDHQPTNAADVYAFAICCIEILGMGELPWATLDNRAIRKLVIDKDERPPIPARSEYDDIANAVVNLIQSCWAREANRRPSFSSITASLEGVLDDHGSHKFDHSSLSSINIGSLHVSTESSPADEQYETASESMRTEVEESIHCMADVSLTSPAPTFGKGRSLLHVNASTHREVMKVVTQATLGASEDQDGDTPIPSPTSKLDVDTRNEANYRIIAGSNHVFHSSLTLPLWSPTRVELGAVGYLSKPNGEFITIFNAMDPLQSCDEQLRQLPSMYGYGKFEVQKREEGKRSMAQRGLDAISVFLTFKSRGDRSHPERISRQYTFPLVQGTSSAHLCVEKTVHRYIDQLEAPSTWFKQHVDLILEVCKPSHAIQREDLILVVGTLDAPDWAVFVSDDHADGRAQFNVFATRERGEPWGMYTVDRAVKNGNSGLGRWVDVGQGTVASKVSSSVGGHDAACDTVMLAGLRPEQEVPTMV